jgi:hypothetical protein
MDQSNKKDLIIGAYTNYGWDQIKYWANSIDRCGFTGDKAMIVYNSAASTVQRLIDMGFTVWAFNKEPSTGNFYWPTDLVIVVQRFYHLWYFLNQLQKNQYRYVISTDVKDVVFQKNPSEWLELHMGDKEIVASCESLKYQDEPWGADNMQGSYPMIWDNIKSQPIWNCGVQAGTMSAMKDLWLNIWLMCKAGGRPNPDQAAYNLLLNTVAWSRLTNRAMSDDGWACQAGTTVDPSKIINFRPNLLEPEPIWDGTVSKTSTGVTHAILHQWDRVPAWKPSIEKNYG